MSGATGAAGGGEGHWMGEAWPPVEHNVGFRSQGLGRNTQFWVWGYRDNVEHIELLVGKQGI